MSVTEVANMLGLTRRTVINAILKGKLIASKIPVHTNPRKFEYNITKKEAISFSKIEQTFGRPRGSKTHRI